MFPIMHLGNEKVEGFAMDKTLSMDKPYNNSSSVNGGGGVGCWSREKEPLAMP